MSRLAELTLRPPARRIFLTGVCLGFVFISILRLIVLHGGVSASKALVAPAGQLWSCLWYSQCGALDTSSIFYIGPLAVRGPLPAHAPQEKFGRKTWPSNSKVSRPESSLASVVQDAITHQVFITGHNLPNSSYYECSIDGQVVSAKWLTRTLVACNDFRATAPKNVAVVYKGVPVTHKGRNPIIPQMNLVQSDGASTFLSARQNLAPQYVSLVCVFRDQTPYLLEFIEYYRWLGISHFYFYDNFSKDQPEKLLAPYISAGIVTLIQWPHSKAQNAAFTDALVRFRYEAVWLVFADVDEFWVPVGGAREHGLWEMLQYYDNPAQFPWLYGLFIRFGSSGHSQKPDGLVIESYTWCQSDANQRRSIYVVSGKSIIRTSEMISAADVHYFVHFGEDTENRPRWQTIFEKSVARVNHYTCKSKEDFDKKRRIGGGVSFGYEHLRFREFDFHDEQDFSLVSFGPVIRERMKQTVNPR